MDSSEGLEHNPDLCLAQWNFLLQSPDDVCSASEKAQVKAQLMDALTKNDMEPLYRYLCAQNGWQEDTALSSKMRGANKEKLKKLKEQHEDALENLGENEVREALLQKAEYLCRIGEKDKAITAFEEAFKKTVGIGQKIDIVLYLIRIGLFFNDPKLITDNVQRCKELVEEGGDWERKNRLKVYEAYYHMSIRNFKLATSLFLDTITTFTAYEVMPYKDFVYYTVLCSLVSLDRVTLKKKVVDSPEVLQVVRDTPSLPELLNSFYDCNYSQFFTALSSISELTRRDRLLSPHARHYCREMRIAAYTQFLTSYRSVTLTAMAASFAVSIDYLDRELSRFISSGRLHCKVDKVNGIVETTRPDSRNKLYQDTIRQGDLLLNRIQKLSRVINV